MKPQLLFIFLLLFSKWLHGQPAQNQWHESNKGLSSLDSLTLVNVPALSIPEHLKGRTLPPMVDNSALPYFRPIFSQEGASCGQAAGVAYAFTYEMCRKRNVHANIDANQFPSHFVYNFMNYMGWYGVNYMHSFEVLQALGTPTVQTYGGIAIDNGNVWISGYNTYYGAMKNRVRTVKKINVGTPEGLLTLKHWLAHHLEGAATGGVANFNAASPYNMQNLPASSPEAGKKVVTQFPGTYATHAMTIVGYNDSIRFDYNGDGKFTNHIDINNDGIVNMRDWEMGGLKFANSYGAGWADAGFCYMMYRTLAENVTAGGIWNHIVHVLDVNQAYQPLITMKLIVKHDRREQIRITAGISTQLNSTIPEHLMYFPVFNFQGGPQYMQGGISNDENKTIEIGLDITPLLSYIQSGQQARFFLQIDENDPVNQGVGSVIRYSIMDYNQNEPQEIVCAAQNVSINDNAVTRLSIQHAPVFDKVCITSVQIPVFDDGIQMQAEGGAIPYRWDMVTPYHQQIFNADFPQVNAEQLQLETPNLKFARKKIDFDFPFYGKNYDEIFVHKDGFLLFEPEIYPWPYYKEPYLLFRSMKNIAAFLFSPIKYYEGIKTGEGIWYEGNNLYAAFRWKQPLAYYNQTLGFAEFALKLYPNGNIEYFYNDIRVTENLLWYAGVSAGENTLFKLIEGSNKSTLPYSNAYRLVPENVPKGIELSSMGLLSGTNRDIQQISNLNVKVLDDRNTTDQKVFQFSDGLRFSYNLKTTDSAAIHNGSKVIIDFTVKNYGIQTISNLNVKLKSADFALQIFDSIASYGILQVNDSITIENAFELEVLNYCSDNHTIFVEVWLNSSAGLRKGLISIDVKAPLLVLDQWGIIDDGNKRLDPGETAVLVAQLNNNGRMIAKAVSATLVCNDPYITILQPAAISFGNLLPGSFGKGNFTIAASANCPITHIATFVLHITDESGKQWTETFQITVGQYAVLVFNKAKNTQSASAITAVLENLQLDYVYTEILPPDLINYRSIFVCLGTFYSNRPLSMAEGEALSNYLEQNGRIYMEGTITWHLDQQTAVHSKFNLGVIKSTTTATLTDILGVHGSFAAGHSFPFSGLYAHLPWYLSPLNQAFPLFRTNIGSDTYTMIGFQNNRYKTIGSMFEFSALGNQNHFLQRTQLMIEIVRFFDMGNMLVALQKPVNSTQAGILPLVVKPNPFSDMLNVSVNLSANSPFEWSIYNLNGQLIWRETGHHNTTDEKCTLNWSGKTIQNSQAKPGMYFVQFKSGATVQSAKVVKQ